MSNSKPEENPFERKTMTPQELNFLKRKFSKRNFGSTMLMVCFAVLSVAFLLASTMMIFFVVVVPFTTWATIVFWRRTKKNNEDIKKDLIYAKKLIFHTILEDKIEEDMRPYRTWIVTPEGKFHVSSPVYYEIVKGDKIILELSEYSRTLIDFQKVR